MSSLLATFRSSLGSKYLMAVTGVILMLWIVAHLVGNLQVFPLFGGRPAFNDYAQFLKAHPGMLWGARIVMSVVFVTHVVTGIRLARANKAARPVPYAHQATIQASYASRSMLLTGLCIAAYLVYHLLHFTLGVTNPDHANLHEIVAGGERHDVFSMVVLGFRQPLIALAYVVAMLLLGLHLSHGASSFFQTLGLNHARYNGVLRKVGPVFGAIVAAGFLSIPVAVWLGIVTLPGGK